MIEPYYKDDYCELYLGDSSKLLWDLPSKFAHAVITDPPYLLDGKTMNWDGGRDYVKDIEENDFADSFDFMLLTILGAKLINPNMIFFHNKAQTFDYLKYAKDNKLNWQLLEWHKPDCIPIGGLYLLDTEYAAHLYKGIKVKRKPMNTYWLHGIVKSKWAKLHPTSKPERIMIDIINQLTDPGDIVIEPFSGSGTTAACCKMLGRKCIAFEIKEKYAEVSADRIRSTEANQIQNSLFELM